MSWRAQISRSIQELRFVACETSQSSQGLRYVYCAVWSCCCALSLSLCIVSALRNALKNAGGIEHGYGAIDRALWSTLTCGDCDWYDW